MGLIFRRAGLIIECTFFGLQVDGPITGGALAAVYSIAFK